MAASLARSQHKDAPFIPTAIDFRTRVKEAAIAIESALVAAELLADHGIVESGSYDQLVDFMQEAATAVDLIDAGLLPAPVTIFPSRASAEAFLERHPLPDADHLYQIHADGSGRCTVSIFKLVAWL